MANRWRRYEELRPDELDAIVNERPVAFWPLGLLEHHGWSLPVGYDGIKADRICQRVAAHTGGVILPVMWWGGGGGHDIFRWSHYQDLSATESILRRTVEQLELFGFRVAVLLAGHYPWQSVLNEVVPEMEAGMPSLRIFAGTELTVAGDLGLRGDHAALEETSYGLALFPELVDTGALTSGRDNRAWPRSTPPPAKRRHPGVVSDTDNPLYAQYGEDSRTASAERGEQGLEKLVETLRQQIDQALQETSKGLS
ncbi:MAG: creatininase family protein [Candidatus Latescibacterota bacterium]|nr:creatininase family protein [Candidatus Latescibacterota bacterium]